MAGMFTGTMIGPDGNVQPPTCKSFEEWVFSVQLRMLQQIGPAG